MDVLKSLKKQHDLSIVVDAVALQDLGVDLDTDVTLEVTGVQLRTPLKLLLEPLKLDYFIRDGVLVVSSGKVASEFVTTQVYRSQISGEYLEPLAESAEVEIRTMPVRPAGHSVVIVTGKPAAIGKFEELAEQVAAASRPEAATPVDGATSSSKGGNEARKKDSSPME